MEPNVYPVRQYKPEMAQLEKEYRNHLMLERLRPIAHAKIKETISAFLFNLRVCSHIPGVH